MRVRKTDLSWAAGVFEGEGSAGLRRRVSPRTGKVTKCPFISVGMTDRAVLEELKRILGGGIYNNRPAEYVTNAGQHTKALYRWGGEWRQALKAAQKLLPHVVGEKRQKLQEIVGYYEKKDRKKDVE